jgi:hypothetical protein
MILATRDILQSLRHRPSRDFGIATAYQHLKSVEPCFSGGLCPANVWSTATPAMWRKAVKHSKRCLSYGDKETFDRDFIVKSVNEGTSIAPGAVLEYDTVLSSTVRDRDGDILESSGLELDTKMPLLMHHVPMSPIGKMCRLISQDERRVIVKNAIADTSLGRDAAVLVKFGALRTSHGFKPVPGEFAPLATTKAADGRDIVTGWHIKRARVYECSLVTIPSNTEAEILGFDDGMASVYSKGLLQTPFFRSLCKAEFDRRPATIQAGIDLSAIGHAAAPLMIKEGQQVTVTYQVKSADHAGCSCNKGASMATANTDTANTDDASAGSDATTPEGRPDGEKGCGGPDMGGKCKTCGKKMSGGKCPHCEAGGKSTEPTDTKSTEGQPGGDSPSPAAGDATAGLLQIKALADLATKAVGEDSYYLPGSFEWVKDKLEPLARKHLAANGADVDDDCWTSVIATFADSVIVNCRTWGSGGWKNTCFRVGWEMNGDMPKLTGAPAAVQVTTVVLTKAAQPLINNPDGPLAIKSLASAMLRQAALADTDDAVELIATTAKNLADMAGMHDKSAVQAEAEAIETLLGIH